MTLPAKVTLSTVAVIVVAFAGLLALQCARSDGIATGRQLAHDDATDRINAARASAEVEANMTWRRQLAALADTNRALTQQLGRQAPAAAAAAAAIVASPDTLVPKRVALAVLAENVLLRGVIAQDSVGIRARDGRILALEGSVRSYTDSIVPELTRDRDRWKRQALRSRRCGLGGTIGYGVGGADAVAGFTCRISLPFGLF